MQPADVVKRVPTLPLIFTVLLLGALALLVESQLRVAAHLPGHRAWPGAMALVVLAGHARRPVLLGFAAVLGIVIALTSHNPLLAIVWLAPATLLALVQPRSAALRVAVALGAGLAFGLLRYLALPGAFHHTPEAVRLVGHLVFGALGSLGVALDARLGRRAS